MPSVWRPPLAPTRCPARRYHRATTQQLEGAPPLSGDVYNTVHPSIVFIWSTHGAGQNEDGQLLENSAPLWHIPPMLALLSPSLLRDGWETPRERGTSSVL